MTCLVVFLEYLVDTFINCFVSQVAHDGNSAGHQGHREITSHVSIYTIHLDGLRQLFRHFLRLPDGAIVEVFGDLGSVGQRNLDNKLQSRLQTANEGESREQLFTASSAVRGFTPFLSTRPATTRTVTGARRPPTGLLTIPERKYGTGVPTSVI